MPKKRPKRRTAAEMLPLVVAWRQGKGSQAEIAAAHGMPSPTFSWWCARLGRTMPRPGRLVAVDVEPEAVADGDGAFEVLLARGRSLRVPSNFDADALARLVGVLERPC